jgi:thiol-disulfide isomerase/thioredoxin
MKISRFLSLLIGLALVGCASLPTANPLPEGNTLQENPLQKTTSTPEPKMASYPDLGLAPELENTVWLNTDQPLRLKNLRGKVVLLEMWTFDCINCQDVMPSLRGWYQAYKDRGLVIIGNHFPEFPFEKDLGNLKTAVQQDQILYPVAQDNDGKTWSAYHNSYWPTLYLIDKSGHIRYTHIGEGAYAETQTAIEDLLKETY